ncbi:hypothetical protein LT493_06380 [Streptomyces tricolor]|nr:hypothetical protein [Streptomyces tricolor]
MAHAQRLPDVHEEVHRGAEPRHPLRYGRAARGPGRGPLGGAHLRRRSADRARHRRDRAAPQAVRPGLAGAEGVRGRVPPRPRVHRAGSLRGQGRAGGRLRPDRDRHRRGRGAGGARPGCGCPSGTCRSCSS